MNRRLQLVLLGAGAVSALVLLGWAESDPGEPDRLQLRPASRDPAYMGTETHSDGASTVLAKGPSLRYPSNAQAYDGALAYQRREEYGKAEALLQAILERTPDEPVVGHALATGLFLQRRYLEAEAAYRRVLAVDPRFHAAHSGLGAVASAQGRYEVAAEEFTLAIQGNPDSALAYYGRGIAHFYQGHRPQARADFQRTVELLPASSEMAIRAKAYLADRGDGKGAMQR